MTFSLLNWFNLCNYKNASSAGQNFSTLYLITASGGMSAVPVFISNRNFFINLSHASTAFLALTMVLKLHTCPSFSHKQSIKYKNILLLSFRSSLLHNINASRSYRPMQISTCLKHRSPFVQVNLYPVKRTVAFQMQDI